MFTRRGQVSVLTLGVLIIWLRTTYGQTEYFSTNTTTSWNRTEQINRTNSNNKEQFNGAEYTINFFKGTSDNSSVIVIENILYPHTTQYSQVTMDIINIVWYVATFFALAAFFLLMACTDRRCNDNRRHGLNGNENPIPPPTPSPSYSEFAPPSYESVIKMNANNDPISIYVLPITNEIDNKDGNNNSSQQSTPIINLYTVNELQKFGS